MSEDFEQYDVEIYDGATLKRTFSTLTSATATYTAAMIASDFPSGLPDPVTVKVYQLSASYGRGEPGTKDFSL